MKQKLLSILIVFLLTPTFVQAERVSSVSGWLVVDQALLERLIPAHQEARDPSVDSFSEVAGNIAREHGLPPKLVQSVIQAESSGNVQAVSRKGAMGLMQLMPETAKEYLVSDPFDPLANIRGGVQYLKNLLREFSGNLSLALAAYNAGPGAVRKYRGIPPYPETQSFVQKVKEGYQSGEDAIQSSAQRGINEMGPMDRIAGKIYITGSPRDLAAFLKKMR